MHLPEKLQSKLDQRVHDDSLRSLPEPSSLIDFSSNDYLGLSSNLSVFNQAHQYLLDHQLCHNGSTGSRLLSGNHTLYQVVEKRLMHHHQSPAALIYNSGYDANLGLISCIAGRGDLILYDQLIHASIRDALQMSHAKSVAFKHNNLTHLSDKMNKHRQNNPQQEIYVITESVFSMDGDQPDLHGLLSLCEQYQARLIVDEAHALGVFEWGLAQKHQRHASLFARIMTFGKGLGCHGAAVLGNQPLIQFLTNFSRPFIYTTALPPHSLSTLLFAYQHLQQLAGTPLYRQLHDNIQHFRNTYKSLGLQTRFIDSKSAIQSCVISQNKRVKSLAKELQKNGYDVKPILSPTVPLGQERLRFCLHNFNSTNQIEDVLWHLKEHL